MACKTAHSQISLEVLVGFVLIIVGSGVQSALAQARLEVPTQEAPGAPISSPVSGPTAQLKLDDTAAIQQEVGERDVTYLRTRIVFRYDYKAEYGSASANRFRQKLLYAFGPKQRFGASMVVPVVHKNTPNGSATGSGDTDIAMGANLYYAKRFRTGVAFQVTFQTSSDELIGGSTTTIKPAWGFTAVLSNRFELVSAFFYKQSIHTTRGQPARQFEPDIVFNTRILQSTWSVEWDSFYDFIPGQFAQTLKTGLSRGFGRDRQWVASVYCGFPLNGYGTQTQYHLNPGFDLTWYPFKDKWRVKDH